MGNTDYSYLKAGKASDITNLKDRVIFRIFEIFPGAASLAILIFAVLFSFLFPAYTSLFIICFVVFWVFRTIYFSCHLWVGYRKMEKNEKTDWIEEIKKLPNWKNIYHLIVVPMYKEPYDIIRAALNSIEKTDYPKDRLIVVLGCEERARTEILGYVAKLESEFKDKFLEFKITWHPNNIIGEIAGKGSNETWAAKIAKAEIIDKNKIPYENVVFSSFDADTCVFPKYFSCLTYRYLTAGKPTRTSFQPVPFYINNIWHAPVFSRIFAFSSTFWHTMNQERPEKIITFSSHSMSFKALVDVGFKQTNIVPDDSRIFWQCFFKYDGDYHVEPMYYPLSMDANAASDFSRTMMNIYKQQRRWAYGVSDIPYVMLGFIKNKKIGLRRKWSLGFELIEGHLSWATASILIFVSGWLPLAFGGQEFSHTILSYNLPKVIGKIMTFNMLGLILSTYISFLLLPPKPPEYGRYKYLVFAIGWILFPVTMVFFTSFPALDAQIRLMIGKYMGFWVTEKVRKVKEEAPATV